ncbi:MAG: hypothetical protein ACLPXB_08175 [Thiobacillaceae bacterium]
MAHLSSLPFVARWTEGDHQDPELEEAVLAARHEFSELSDAEVKELWMHLESHLIGWARRRGEALPTYKLRYSRQSPYRNSLSDTDDASNAVDFTLLFFLAHGYGPLERFVEDLAIEPFDSLRKAYALLILREAANDNWSEIRRLARSFYRVVH